MLWLSTSRIASDAACGDLRASSNACVMDSMRGMQSCTICATNCDAARPETSENFSRAARLSLVSVMFRRGFEVATNDSQREVAHFMRLEKAPLRLNATSVAPHRLRDPATLTTLEVTQLPTVDDRGDAEACEEVTGGEHARQQQRMGPTRQPLQEGQPGTRLLPGNGSPDEGDTPIEVPLEHRWNEVVATGKWNGVMH